MVVGGFFFDANQWGAVTVCSESLVVTVRFRAHAEPARTRPVTGATAIDAA